MGDVSGVFIADKSSIEKAWNQYVYLGEVLGKHSEICGNIEPHHLEIKSEDPHIIETLLEIFPGGHIAGINPIDYLEEQDASN